MGLLIYGNGSIGLPPALVKGLTGVHAAITAAGKGVAVLNTGRILVWGGTPPYKTATGEQDFSRAPMPLVLDGLENG